MITYLPATKPLKIHQKRGKHSKQSKAPVPTLLLTSNPCAAAPRLRLTLSLIYASQKNLSITHWRKIRCRPTLPLILITNTQVWRDGSVPVCLDVKIEQSSMSNRICHNILRIFTLFNAFIFPRYTSSLPRSTPMCAL